MSDKAARENWERYEYARTRGHRGYVRTARRNEEYYLGGGLQWTQVDLQYLQSQKRPAYEFNEIRPAIHAALGYQIQNRMDLTLLPVGGEADQHTATIFSKTLRHVMNDNDFHPIETQVVADGLIEQRGYYELRIDFDDSMRGEVKITDLDPRDVIPDPDAKSYDPDDWGDVIITRWVTLDEIEQQYDKDKRAEVERELETVTDDDWDEGSEHEERNKFGAEDRIDSHGTLRDRGYEQLGDDIKRVRVIDRQFWKYALTEVAVFPATGDIRVVEAMDDSRKAEMEAQGAILTKRVTKRVMWVVSTPDTELFNDWSPYEHFTVVPYFPDFRRGKTRGWVDNARGPQDALNKGLSQFVHIVNSTANGGWKVEENSLTNMTIHELEEQGAQTGLVIEYRAGSTEPKKIETNQVPRGIESLIEMSQAAVKRTTMPEAMRGESGPELTGVAIQSKQYAAQQQLAIALDNLARTRRLLARRVIKLVQTFYDDYRVLRITETDPKTGQPTTVPVTINEWDEATGTMINDLTVGEYDVVVTEQPMSVTFEHSQFEQAMRLRSEAGVYIPDHWMLRYSTLADKSEIIQDTANQGQQQDPEKLAKAELLKAQARKALADVDRTDSEAVNKAIEALYSALQTAEIITMNPAAAPLADQLLRSGGFQDRDAAPIVPALPANASTTPPDTPVVEASTNPLTPANPGVGRLDGFEGGETGDSA